MALEKAINTEIPIRGGIPLRSIVPNFSGGHFFFFHYNDSTLSLTPLCSVTSGDNILNK